MLVFVGGESNTTALNTNEWAEKLADAFNPIYVLSDVYSRPLTFKVFPSRLPWGSQSESNLPPCRPLPL